MHSQGYNFDNIDVLGRPFNPLSSHPPPLVPATLDAQCDLSEMLNEIMEHNQKALARDEIGSLDDLRQRRAGYVRLVNWSESLPPALRIGNRSPQTSFVRHVLLHPEILLRPWQHPSLTLTRRRLFINEVAYGIVRPLPLDARFGDRGSVADMLLQHCKNDLEVSEAYTELWPPELSGYYSNGLYNTIITLASLLHEPRSHDLFARACGLERSAARHFPLVRFILKGIHALVLSHGQEIPPAATWCFENLDFNVDDLKDVPVSYALPLHEQVRRSLLTNGEVDDEHEEREMGVQMGKLISRWNGMSMS